MPLRTTEEIIPALIQLRLDAGLSLEMLAEKAEIEASTLSLIETGERALTVREIINLAAALDVSTDAILRDDPPGFSAEFLAAADDSTRDCIAVFDECIDDYFGLRALYTENSGQDN